MHVGYALIVAASLLLYGRRPLVRVLGALYPPFVLLVVVATGNHFFFDAGAGALVAVVAAAAAAPMTRRAAPNRISELPTRTGAPARVRGARGMTTGANDTWSRRRLRCSDLSPLTSAQ
jgi:hypothetical protein